MHGYKGMIGVHLFSLSNLKSVIVVVVIKLTVQVELTVVKELTAVVVLIVVADISNYYYWFNSSDKIDSVTDSK